MQVKELLPGHYAVQLIRRRQGFDLSGPPFQCAYRCRACGQITQVSVPFGWYVEHQKAGTLPEIKCGGSTASADEHDSLTPALWIEVAFKLEYYKLQKRGEAMLN